MIDLIRSLNFFMAYFDPATPLVLVHEASRERTKVIRAPAATDFPDQITSIALDPYLLGLWESATESTDPFRRFVHLYQILECAAFYHLDAGLLQKAKRIIREPDALSAPERTVKRILDALAEDRRRDEAKIVALVSEVVEASRVWAPIARNLNHFTSRVRFDGGFELAGLVKEGWTESEFATHWIPAYPDSLRKIRNALVHGREQRMASVIAPSSQNLDRLRPWIEPLTATAMQVMIYAS